MVKNPPALGEAWVQSLGWEDPLEEGMANHASILAWRISMDRGVWWAIVSWDHKALDMTEHSIQRKFGILCSLAKKKREKIIYV